MTEPTKDPGLLREWGNTIAYVALSVLTTIVTCAGWFYSQLRKLERAEALAVVANDKLTKIGDDFGQHLDEDYVQFREINDRIDGVKDQISEVAAPLSRVEEATEWIKKSLETINGDRYYTHERIKIHDERNKAAAAKYAKEVTEMVNAKDRRILELESQLKMLDNSP